LVARVSEVARAVPADLVALTLRAGQAVLLSKVVRAARIAHRTDLRGQVASPTLPADLAVREASVGKPVLSWRRSAR